MASQEEIAARLRELQDQYISRLSNELETLSELVENILSHDMAPTLQLLHQKLHKLAGSAGTFGFSTLGQQVRKLEIQTQLWLANLPAELPADWNDFAAQVVNLRQCLSSKLPDPAEDTTQFQPMQEAAMEVPRHHEASIYIVDSNQERAEELAFTLRHFGYSTSRFTSITQGGLALRQKRPQVVIIEVEALEKEGTGSLMAFANTPMVFTAARDDFDTRIQVARVGGQGFFLHPVDIPKLVDRLYQLLRTRNDKPYRVLIVDDDLELAEHFKLTLQGAGMEVYLLEEPSHILTTVQEQRPEIILMDLNMPGYSGMELARLLRLQDDWLHTPIVYVSAETDLKKQMNAVGFAGDDFLVKPLSNEQLVAAVTVRVARARMLSELMARDSLTGLFNHSRIKEQLVIELARAKRSGKPLSVAMLDMDKFKTVNDTYGHGVGDRVIKTLAHLLQQRARQSDTVGRYGGEEFAAILPDCDRDAAWKIVDDIRQRFGQVSFVSGGREFHVTLSAGIAASSHYDDSETLLVAADEALYHAKHTGRNRVCMAPVESTEAP